MGMRIKGVGVESKSVSEKITPMQQMTMMQINRKLIVPIRQFFVWLFALRILYQGAEVEAVQMTYCPLDVDFL